MHRIQTQREGVPQFTSVNYTALILEMKVNLKMKNPLIIFYMLNKDKIIFKNLLNNGNINIIK